MRKDVEIGLCEDDRSYRVWVREKTLIYVIRRLGGPYSEKLWPRSWKCPGPQAEGSIFKSEVTVFHYTDRP